MSRQFSLHDDLCELKNKSIKKKTNHAPRKDKTLLGNISDVI
jgi:hypothetical protein